MAKIIRDPEAASKENFDLIIIGGGVYGVMLSLEASFRGLKSLLIERDDFGGATSFNSLRIIHGGFRYFQNLDFRRCRESVAERRWFLRAFPERVKPLPCLMPLYSKGFRRPFILSLGLLLNEIISYHRNIGVRPDRKIPGGKVVSTAKVKDIFPSVDMEGLKGGAVWYDAFIPDSQRLIMEILRLSCEYGAVNLNYVKAQRLLTTKESVAGIMALDRISGNFYKFKAKFVINASGPWCRDVATRFDKDEPSLFRSSLVWNVLLNKKSLSDHALAVSPKKPQGQTYFIVPWKGLVFAGTGHASWLNNSKDPMPSVKQLQEFLNDLNLAVPSLKVEQKDIVRVFPGLQPATEIGGNRLASREIIHNHAKYGGPSGFYSISGVKFTTSRSVAEKTLQKIYYKKKHLNNFETIYSMDSKSVQGKRGIIDIDQLINEKNTIGKENLYKLITEESVIHLDDLVFRRTNLWETPERVLEIAPSICGLFDWNASRTRKEIERLKEKLII